MKKLPGPKRCMINSTLNSESDSASLADLDWDNWWEDRSFGSFYLHVRKIDARDHNDETWHRVYPKPVRGHTCTGLAAFNGTLFWMHRKKKPTTKTK